MKRPVVNSPIDSDSSDMWVIPAPLFLLLLIRVHAFSEIVAQSPKKKAKKATPNTPNFAKQPAVSFSCVILLGLYFFIGQFFLDSNHILGSPSPSSPCLEFGTISCAFRLALPLPQFLRFPGLMMRICRPVSPASNPRSYLHLKSARSTFFIFKCRFLSYFSAASPLQRLYICRLRSLYHSLLLAKVSKGKGTSLFHLLLIDLIFGL